MTLNEKTAQSIAAIYEKTPLRPELALVLGSGLGGMGERLEEACVIPYETIPHFARSTAPGHAGRLLIGRLGGKAVLCMQGRFHYFEGYPMSELTYPVRVMGKMGIQTLVITNSAGGLNKNWKPGDLMLITDHINFMGNNPLIGPNADDFGPRFPDMTTAYTPALQDLARKTAVDLDIQLREGVYLGYMGPSFETPAEIRLFQSFGVSACGMSTVPEVIAARHCGLDILAISCITNLAAGILAQAISSDEVNETAGIAGERFSRLLTEIVRRI
ncbi:MAG: purine-nucleoside phosphorylase [Treponema sp.]|jgi:purine-nucleoside phosphorylase|nr:purine-nucleoside phosphorylase [Treponema sp.]